MATQTLEELLIAINATTAELRKEMAVGKKSVKDFGKDVDSSLTKIDAKFSKVTRSVARSIGGLVAGLSLVGVARQASQSLASLEEVGRQADSLGATAESIQELTLTFREFDLESNDVSDALGTIADRAQDAQDGMQSFIDDFKLLGVSVDDLRGKRPEELFSLIADRVSEIEDPTRRTAGIVRIFGDDLGRRLAPLLLQGSDGLDRYAARWRDLGAIVDDAGVRRAGPAAEKFRELQASIGGRFTQVVADNAEKIEVLAEALLSASAAAIQFSSNIAGVFSNSSAIPFQKEIDDATDRIVALRKELADLQITNLTGAGTPQISAINAEIAAQQKLIEELTLKQKEAFGLIGGGAASSGEQKLKEAGSNAGDAWFESFLASIDSRAFEVPEIERFANEFDQRLIPTARLTEGDSLNRGLSLSDILDSVFDDIEDKANDTAGNIDESYSVLARSLGFNLRNALADSFLGIEQDFSDVLARMAADLAASGLLSVLSTAFGAPTAGFLRGLLPGFASGGRTGRQPFIAGERGPEIVFPEVSGRVVTASQTERMMRGGGGGTVHQEFNFPLAFPPQLESFVRNVAGAAGRDAAVGVLNAQQGRF